MDNGELLLLLARHGMPCTQMLLEDGGSILVVGAGARVLRLIGRSGKDFLWLNNSLPEELAGKPSNSLGWLNLGGDRTLIAPEADYFIRDLRDPWNTYVMAEQFDPGNYGLTQDASSSRLTSRFCRSEPSRRERRRTVLEKTVKAAPNPFRYERDARHLMSAEYAGYEQTTTLALLSDPAPGLTLGLWHLTQVPAVGDIVIPVSGTVTPHIYFGQAEHIGVESMPGLVRFRTDNSHCSKIGIKAISVFGRVGYVRQEDNEMASLLIRNFLVNPSAEYVDTPWNDLEDQGYAVQSYNDDGKLGSFGELEYHTPGIGDGTNQTSYTDCSQLWAFRAARPAIREIGKRLLAVDLGVM